MILFWVFLSLSFSFISCRILLSPCFEISGWCALVCVSCIYCTVLGIQWVLSNWESMSLSLESYDELFLWWLSLHSFLQVFSGTRRFRCWTPRSGLLIFFFLFYCSVFLRNILNFIFHTAIEFFISMSYTKFSSNFLRFSENFLFIAPWFCFIEAEFIPLKILIIVKIVFFSLNSHDFFLFHSFI